MSFLSKITLLVGIIDSLLTVGCAGSLQIERSCVCAREVVLFEIKDLAVEPTKNAYFGFVSSLSLLVE